MYRAKLAMFIRGVFQKFYIFENFLSLVPMQSTTTGKDILETIVEIHNSLWLCLKTILLILGTQLA